MRGPQVGEELRNNCTLGDDLIVDDTIRELDRWDQATLRLVQLLGRPPGTCKSTYRIDLQIPWLSGSVKIDDGLFERQTELVQGCVSSMSIGAVVVGVEMDLGRSVTVDGAIGVSVYRSCHLECLEKH